MTRNLFVVTAILSTFPWLAGCPCGCEGTQYAEPLSTVQGTVTDSATGQPLADATVATSNSDYALTDANGRYSLERPREHLIVLKRGYYADLTETSRLPVGSAVTFDIALVRGDVTDTTPPPAPVAISINGWDSQSNISWELTTAEPPDFAGFVVYRGSEPTRFTLYNYLVARPVDDPASCYSVATIDASGNESAHRAALCHVVSSTCAIPELDRAKPEIAGVSSNEIKLHWALSTRIPLAEQNIYRDGVLLRALSPGENWDSNTSTQYYNNYSYSDTGLSSNTRYCYSIAAASDGAQGCNQACISTWP